MCSRSCFLKYISDVWKKHYEEYTHEFADSDPETRDLRIKRRMERERFKLPAVELKDDKTGELIERFLADFYSLHERRNRDNVGELINIAVEAIERANEPEAQRSLP